MASTPPLDIPQHSGIVRFKRAREFETGMEDPKGKRVTTIGEKIFDGAIGEVTAWTLSLSNGPEPASEEISQGTSDVSYGRSRRKQLLSKLDNDTSNQGRVGKSRICSDVRRSVGSSHVNLSIGEGGKRHNLCIAWRCDEADCSRLSMDVKGKCMAHLSSLRCNEVDRNNLSQSGNEKCTTRGVSRRCREVGCKKLSRVASGRCIVHGGGRRCDEANCEKFSRNPSSKCSSHGGGRRCVELGCEKLSSGAGGKCKAHGGGRRCDELGCEKLSKGANGRCIAHGGGRR